MYAQDKFFPENLFNIAAQLMPFVQSYEYQAFSCLNSEFGSVSECELASDKSSSNDQSMEDIEEAVRRELLAVRQVPYRDYVCHRCGQKGHMIRHCPTKNPEQEPTPYQGNRRSIGVFNCGPCNRQWRSKNTFANKTYPCNTCGRLFYPTKMYPIGETPE
ncbi:unnamed protein product [Auanema sp. JU1783]|nr:unnamed protein product [Auanema sp. JU1783]